MPTVNVYNLSKEKVGELTLNEAIFNRPVEPHLLHRVVTMQLANRRSGTAATKGRSQVRGGGKKPFRQKGGGRARAGANTSPLMRKGGVVFGPQPRVYQVKVPKKMKKLALRMALSSKWQSDRLLVLENFNLDEIKTKNFVRLLDRFDLKKTLFILEQENLHFEKSARNLPSVKTLRVEGLNVYDILKFEHLVLNQPSVMRLEETLSQ
jgi:large subunit ribosomal protein L4